tara:strand:- start:551 stop:808 length:258 start_codon:yes stop_codon:yes gene_type:complete
MRQTKTRPKNKLGLEKIIMTRNVFLVWVFGFFVLLSFDLFIEGLVFEWLAWNGTDKNDWFFMLWWGAVTVWFFHGLFTLYERFSQ